MTGLAAIAAGLRPPRLEAIDMSKRFGSLLALDAVSLSLDPGDFHAILGENGAGKSTLVKCIMGYYRPDSGRILIDGTERQIDSPRQAHRLGLGLVYQHFTLVPNMTALENLVLGLDPMPPVIDWEEARTQIEAFQRRMPLRIDLDAKVTSLAAGERQKLEILKQLFLGRRVLILDEPTSVLTPAEADLLLGLLRMMTEEKALSVILITHKLREVLGFARSVAVLRGGRQVGGGAIGDLGAKTLTRLMFDHDAAAATARREPSAAGTVELELRGLAARNDKGLIAVHGVSLALRRGEILGIAGVSGNGQRELVEVLAGQRRIESGEIRVAGKRYRRTRREMKQRGVFLLTEEPMQNACVRSMSVLENLAFRNFDEPSYRKGCFLDRGALRRQAARLIERYGIRTSGPDARIDTLSGGNVQRTVLARELSGRVLLLIAQNPCFGLDLAATAEIRGQILAARNGGAAILLISEDLDEILELADRIAVMFEGRLVYEAERAQADIHEIGLHMASRQAVPRGGLTGAD
ncbi:MAG: ABC transporter ATP-binding protein [Alphaproteobacteria bacterium]|nr:ABC transporter ATP-binding protein [Alphaproteobacteria bacterium]